MHQTGAMQDAGYGLPRTCLLRNLTTLTATRPHPCSARCFPRNLPHDKVLEVHFFGDRSGWRGMRVHEFLVFRELHAIPVPAAFS